MVKEIISGALIGLAVIFTVITGTPLFELTELSIILPLQQSSTGLWDVLNFLSQIVPPILGAIITVIIWLHRRLKEIEQRQNNIEKSVFGSDRDALNEGAIAEIKQVSEQVEQVQETIEEMKQEH
jgi:hypothetical protein